MLPCITKSVDVCGSFFTKDKFEELKKQDKSVYLFKVNDLQEKSVINYIAKGEMEEINKRYLTASRNPWYSLEKGLHHQYGFLFLIVTDCVLFVMKQILAILQLFIAFI